MPITLHAAGPSITMFLDLRRDLEIAGELEDANDPVDTVAELDAWRDRNDILVAAYEDAFLATLATIAEEREITLEVTWDECAATRYAPEEGSEEEQLLQDVYQEACERTSLSAVRATLVGAA